MRKSVPIALVVSPASYLATQRGDLNFYGTYFQTGYFLTGENRGYDKRTERDFSRPGNFFSNYEPLTHEGARAIVGDAIGSLVTA